MGLILVTATVLSIPAPEALAAVCMPADALAGRLRTERHETVEREEVDARGKLVTHWRAPDGSWSIVLRHPGDQGNACLVAQSDKGAPA